MNLKPLVNNPILYADFLLYIESQLGKIHRSFELTTEPDELRKLQGEARLLRKLLHLKEDVNGRN